MFRPSSFPSAPFPPPPPPNPEPLSSSNLSSSEEIIPMKVKVEVLEQDMCDEISEKCSTYGFNFCRKKLFMTPISSLLQIGPTCGLAIICMVARYIGREVTLSGLLSMAKDYAFTKQGEMFSVANMKLICDMLFDSSELTVEHRFNMEDDKKLIISQIKNGALLFVPYDADFDNRPCLRNGEKAHWALIFGSLEVGEYVDASTSKTTHEDQEIVLLSRHGKTKNIAIWQINELIKSNANLKKIDPKRCNEDYIIPNGGIAKGLCNQYLLLKTGNR